MAPQGRSSELIDGWFSSFRVIIPELLS
jgi:hypothetical protein